MDFKTHQGLDKMAEGGTNEKITITALLEYLTKSI